MKTLRFLTLIALTAGFFSCDSDDDSCVESTFFKDADGDGLGNSTESQVACAAPDGFVANSDDNDDDQPLASLISESVSNLHAPQLGGQGQPVSGPFTKFDFETGQITTSDTDWDIAFRGTTIIVNGGATQGTTDEPNRTGNAAVYIATGTLDGITSIETGSLTQDTASDLAIPSGSNNGWYSYAGPPTHLITPLAGKILVFRTTEGKYAKVEILSYYKDAPANPDAFVNESRYFTFNYVYQPNNNVASF
ncbi:HmuY family protein [Aquimarina sp. 2201CG5-10]|uniref:HmuY family protein n=1 Tax=Aquimarina callyspongiae TaxID=3098150 RepID=UPI002AB57B61|nr:HmuY family protein [Aquimarina sp. 2201CG5-10]MDY8138406.1 HmuY family protein [Aquimarina sp. 2201CG5-10]